MASAREVVALAREDTAAVAAQLRAHPYVAAVEEGRLPRSELARFAGEQWHVISSDLHSVAHLVGRFSGGPALQFFVDVLAGERAALEALLDLARPLGLDAERLRAYEPLAGAHAYTCYMGWLALSGSAGQVAAAYLVNFPAWGENCGRLSNALRQRYGFQPPDVRFFDLFATAPPGFEDTATSVIQGDLDGGTEPVLIRRAVRLLQAYELMYWDTLWSAAK